MKLQDNLKSIKKELERIKVENWSKESIDKNTYRYIRLFDIDDSLMNQKICFFGWVKSSRSSSKISFIELISQFKIIKCVIPTKVKLTDHTTLKVWGIMKPNNGNDEHQFEIDVQAYEVYGGYQAPSFPLNIYSDKDTLLDLAHLGLRMPHRILFLQAQNELLKALRKFYWNNNYTEITPPTLVQTQVEGGATLFKLNYYDQPAYLTQSSQLYLETVAPVVGKAFCIMPSYRAEKSKTSRHLSEFTHVEAELVDIRFDELMDQIEQLIRSAINEFYKNILPEIKKIDNDFQPVVLSDKQFKKITYEDAIHFLIAQNHKKTDNTDYQLGDDISDASEKFLLETYGENQPIFLIRFPTDHKPFYVAKDQYGTQTCDLLFPGIGEIVGGSMRETNYNNLLDGFKRENIDHEPYSWYLDMAKFGPSPHGGYGLGFERLLMCLMKYKSVDQSTLYCRKPSRCTP